MSLEPEIVNSRGNPMGAEHGIPTGERSGQELAVRAESQLPAPMQEMSIEQVVARVEKVRELQRRVMVEGKHYGIIPGTDKPTLYKAGAELMLMTFMLDPQYEHEIKQDGAHREIICKCRLYHIPTNKSVGSGEGSCSTMESKYRWRSGSKCPECEQTAIMRSKYDGGGWYCNPKQGGCGAKFGKSDQRIKAGRQENPDIADQYNTVLKMGNKRSLIAGILNVTAASEIFTQDLEDFAGDNDDGNETPQPRPESKKVETKPERTAAPKQAERPKTAAPAAVIPSPTPITETVETNQLPPPEPAAKPTEPSTEVLARAITQGEMNLLKATLRGAKMMVDDGAIVGAIGRLTERFQIEVEYDDQKSATDNLDAILRKIPGNKEKEVRATIQEWAKEARA